MLYTFALKPAFGQFLAVDKMSRVASFFKDVLQVPDATLEELIEELRWAQHIQGDSMDHERASILYRWIAAETASNDGKRQYVRYVSPGTLSLGKWQSHASQGYFRKRESRLRR